MRTVNEVSKLTGVSVRTLHYYDRIGLLRPSDVTDAGYRLYDDTALERLQQILLFRELEFPLKEIGNILDAPDFDRGKALSQQIKLLTLKKEHLEHLIDFAREIKQTGEKKMDFSAFDTKKIEAYTARAKESWGQTSAWQEYEQKSKDWGEAEQKTVTEEMMEIFTEFGNLRTYAPEAGEVQAQVNKLQSYITGHFYTCTPEILSSLGVMYEADGEFTANIDAAGGDGTAKFVAEAIAVYCKA